MNRPIRLAAAAVIVLCVALASDLVIGCFPSGSAPPPALPDASLGQAAPQEPIVLPLAKTGTRMAAGNIPPAALISCPAGMVVGLNLAGVMACMPGSGLGTNAYVVTGTMYAVLNTDTVVQFDTSNPGDAGAYLPTLAAPGELHTFCWSANDAGAAPIVNAALVDGGALMAPYSGASGSWPASLTTYVTMTTSGACKTWKWTGSVWSLQ